MERSQLSRHTQFAALTAAVLGLGIYTTASRADQTKADNATPLNQAASWVGGAAVPGPADRAIFNATLITNNTFSLGNNAQSWLGIQLLNPASNITINGGNLLTLGTGGIDMTAATVNLTLNNSLTLTGAGQTWDTGTTSTLLSLNGPLALGTGTLTTQGSGTVSISGNISGGAGNRIIQNGSGNLFLSGTNSFARLSINAGLVRLGSAGALPAASTLNVDGGTLNLNGFNATVSALTGASGLITDNAAGAGTSTLRVNQAGGNNSFGGNINNGATRSLALIKAGAGTFNLNGANTYSGGTTITQGILVANNDNALGSAAVTIATGSNLTHLHVMGGITISNNITTSATIAGTGNNGVLMYGGGTGNATFAGSVIFAGPNVTQGGDIGGATAANTFLNFTGPLLFSGNPARTFIIVRFGNVSFSGGGNYTGIDLRTGTTILGANDGIAPSAVIDLAGNGPETWDLSGFNQIITGVKNTVTPGNTKTITNSSATFSTLTFAPSATGNFTFGGAGTASMTGNLSVTINGSPTGVQALSTGASSYTGTTTLTSGVLAITSIADGGVVSSIGAAVSDQSNLIFDGGTLRFTTSFGISNRDFTINNGKTAFIEVPSASILQLTGNTPTATTGGLTKIGFGSLVLAGTHSYTGATSVNAGTLQVDGSLAAGSIVTVARDAALMGNGTINGTVILNAGAVLAPGASVGTLTTGSLALNTASIANFEFGASNNDRVQVANVGGLSLTGGNLNLFQEGGSSAFTTNGTYILLSYNTTFTGSPSNLAITNPQAGKLYTIADNPGAKTIELTIADGVISEWQNPAGSTWTTAANWNNGVPNAIAVTPKFGSNLAAPGVIALNGAKTVGGIIFDSFNSYTIGNNADVLTIDNGAGAAIGVVNGAHIIAAPIVLQSATTVTAASNLTISGNISGAKGLALLGTGNLILTGSNSYTTTNIGGGTLTVGDGGTTGTLGTGEVSIGPAGNLTLNHSDTLTIANNISGSGGTVFANGSGTVILSGNNTFGTAAGGLTVNGATVKLGSATGLPSNVILNAVFGAIDLNGFNAAVANLAGTAGISDSSATPGTSTLTLGGADSAFYSGAINNGPTRTLALVKRDSGTTTLAASSNFSGGTSLIQGVLASSAAAALGTGNITMTVNGSNITRLDVGGDLANNIIINAVSPGSGFGSINGTAQAVISGVVTINVASPGGVGHISGPAGGFLEFTGPINSAAPVIVRAGNVRLTGGGTYTDLQIQSGTTSLGSNTGIPANTLILIANNGGATLDLNGFSQTLAGISRGGGFTCIVTGSAASTLTMNTTADNTFDGLLQGGMSLVKTGPAVFTSTGSANSYTGQTTVLQGALLINTNVNLGDPATGATLVLNGGTLRTGGTFSMSNGTNGGNRNISILAGGGSIDLTGANTLTVPGVISGSGAFSVTGAGASVLLVTGPANYSGLSTIGAGATVEFGGNVTHSVGRLDGAGTVQVDAGTTLESGLPLPNTLANLIVNGTHRIVPNAALTNRTGRVTNLTLAGAPPGAWTGKLDLRNNNLIVTNGANVQDQIKQAANLGAWNGTGGITSSAALVAATGSTATALAYATGAEYTAGNGNTAFDGLNFGASDSLIMYTLAGDANMDKSVTFADFLQLQNNYNKVGTNWEQGDWNYDGSTTFSDFLILQNNYNKTLSVSNLQSGGGAAAVPEPASLLLLTLSATALLPQRRRKPR